MLHEDRRGITVKSSAQNDENPTTQQQQTMGHGPDDSSLQMTGASSGGTRSFKGRPREDLASKHPMGRGAIAAAVEAMKKPR
jgi:hypothetical protein